MSRLVLFQGKGLYFSDVGRPTSVVAENVLLVPSEKDITAIEEHLGNLLIWTEDETWLFRPSNEFVITTGRLTKLALAGQARLLHHGGQPLYPEDIRAD
jgi:hypothetical protein